MGKYREIKGDLIELSLTGIFNVVAHGCNCFCTQLSGLAPQMVKAFATDTFPREMPVFKGDINKLGTIDYRKFGKDRLTGEVGRLDYILDVDRNFPVFHVVNAYTQFNYGRNHEDGDELPISYEAIALCMKKINHQFKGQEIGLPKIGAGLGSGDWNRIKSIIQEELKDCNVTVVIYNK